MKPTPAKIMQHAEGLGAPDAETVRKRAQELATINGHEQFSEDETQRQLETAINWGRYAELFDYDASRCRFIQIERHEAETAEIDG